MTVQGIARRGRWGGARRDAGQGAMGISQGQGVDEGVTRAWQGRS